MSLGAEEIGVPDVQQATNDWNILFERGGAEVVVHCLATCKELVPVLIADVNTHAEPNGRPDRVATANPIIEAKHVLAVDAEFLHLLRVRRESDEVLCDIALLARLQEPMLRRSRVRYGLCGCERLTCDQEQRRLRVTILERLRHGGAVDVRHKVQLHTLLAIRLERLANHHGPQVRPADADVDDSVNLLPCVAFPLSAPHLLRELLHMLQHIVDLFDDTLPIHLHGLVLHVPQRHMIHRPLLGEIDLVALEHGIPQLLQLRFLRQLHEVGQRLVGEEVLAEVEDDLAAVGFVLEGARVLLEAVGVFLELRLQHHAPAELLMMFLQRLPSRKLHRLSEARHCVGVVVSVVLW